MSFEEKTFISEFNVLQNKNINVRKTTQILKNGAIVSEKFWRCSLSPHDSLTQEVLGSEPYYLNLAQKAWEGVDVPSSNSSWV